MRRMTRILAIAAALAAFPALAEEDPVAGFDRDPFSQTYDGWRREAAPAEREAQEKEAKETSRDRASTSLRDHC